MIDFVRGKVAALCPTEATIDTGAMGYRIFISLNTYAAVESAAGKDAPLRLFTHMVIREDAWSMYGFAEERERALFRLLIGVSGVGAATAMLILSAYGCPRLEEIISGGDARALKTVKGVGAKTAERIIVDLRDKIKPTGDTLSLGTVVSASAAARETFEEALGALVMLGYTKAAAQKALSRIMDANPTIRVEAAIKQALAAL